MSAPAWHVFSRRTLRGLRYYFHFRARNGEIVAPSQGYRRRVDAVCAVNLLKDEGPLAKIIMEPTL